MKFLTFVMYDVAKAADMAAVADKMANIPGTKLLTQYVCQALAFPNQPLNTLVAVGVREADSNEAISASIYPLAVAGATVWCVPVQEVAVGAGAETEKKYRA